MLLAALECPFCGIYGQPGFRLCSNGQNIVVMCDECNYVWVNVLKIDVENAYLPLPPNFYIPEIGCSVRKPEASWATRNDIERAGYTELVKGERKALGEL